MLSNAATSKPRLYLPQLDAMRFSAFLAVFCIHGLPSVDPHTHPAGLPRLLAVAEYVTERAGANGVGLFFLLSAFLITELLRREHRSTGAIHLRQFYLRRLLRIWPLYFLVLTIGLLLQPLAPNFHLPALTVASAVLFLLNWNFALNGFIWNPIYILWTVSSEEQFYAVWPLLMKHLPRRGMVWACIALVLLSLAVAFWPGNPFLAHQTTDLVANFACFPIGGLLALWIGSARPPRSTLWCLGNIVTGLAGWFLGGLLTLPTQDIHFIPRLVLAKTLVLAGTVLLFLGFLRSHPARWPAWCVYLGKISYGLYVFHVMALDLVLATMDHIGLNLRTGAGHSASNLLLVFGIKLPAAMLLSIAAAAASYRWFESPFLRLKRRFELVQSRAV